MSRVPCPQGLHSAMTHHSCFLFVLLLYAILFVSWTQSNHVPTHKPGGKPMPLLEPAAAHGSEGGKAACVALEIRLLVWHFSSNPCWWDPECPIPKKFDGAFLMFLR